MSGKKINMAEMELTGKVILQKFAGGSKSDHDAIFLDTGKEKLRLKRKGGNPFYDSSLHELVGKTIKARGKITPYFFEITNTPEEIP